MITQIILPMMKAGRISLKKCTIILPTIFGTFTWLCWSKNSKNRSERPTLKSI